MAIWLVASGLGWAGGMRATVRLGPEGPEIVSARPTVAPVPSAGPGVLEVVDEAGAVLATAAIPDARRRSVIDPEGGGVAVDLDTATVVVEVPWPAGAVAVRTSLGGVRPQPLDLHRAAQLAAVPVLESGPAGERLDLVILGDGYTEEQLADFADDAQWVVDYLLGIPPYGAYSDLFNVWRIDTASAESGLDHPARDEYRDTALGCAYDCAGVDRLVCCDDDVVLRTVEEALSGADGILVLLNDDEYGGSGGFNYATAYVGPAEGREVAAHELGHSLVGLWDEYEYGVAGSKQGPNCSELPTGHWDDWLGSRGVSAFPGCSFSNLYRPTDEGCMMRTLAEGYCPVCREQTVLEMYRRLPGIVTSIDPPPGEAVTGPIAVETTIPTHRLAFEWSLDGEVVLEDEPELDVRCSGLEGQLTLRVHDPTPWVRADPGGLLEETLGPWDVAEPDCARERPVACSCASGPRAGWLGLLGLLLVRRRR